MQGNWCYRLCFCFTFGAGIYDNYTKKLETKNWILCTSTSLARWSAKLAVNLDDFYKYHIPLCWAPRNNVENLSQNDVLFSISWSLLPWVVFGISDSWLSVQNHALAWWVLKAMFASGFKERNKMMMSKQTIVENKHKNYYAFEKNLQYLRETCERIEKRKGKFDHKCLPTPKY